jgi:hypothetical protein
METDDGLQTGYEQVLQMGLTHQLCLELAETLKKAADDLLDANFSSVPVQ